MAKVHRVWVRPTDYRIRILRKDVPQWEWVGRSSNYKDIDKAGPFKTQKAAIDDALKKHSHAEIVVVFKTAN